MAKRAVCFIAATVFLSGCADTGPPAPDRDANDTAALDIGKGGEAEITPGAWQVNAEKDSPTVLFRANSGEPLFSIGCDLRGGLLFQRHGFVARANLGQMQLRTGGNVRRLASGTISGDEPYVQARAPYNDQLIPALIRFDNPLEVRVEALDTLTLPPSAGVRAQVQSCQRVSRPAPEAEPSAAD